MTTVGLIDKILAVAGMLAAIGPVVRSSIGSTGSVSWRRVVVMAAGGLFALFAVTGLLLVRYRVMSEDVVYWPTWLGGTLAFFGGMLGVATLFAGRLPADKGVTGMTEDAAIRNATLAVAMSVYLAAPAPVLAVLALTRLLRAGLPWTLAQARWASVAEGTVLALLCLLTRDETVGGLRQVSGLLGSL
jgi:hypothetical protein